MKPKDKVWQLFRQSENKSVSCIYCDAKYKFANVNKMKNHITTCVKCPEMAKEGIRAKTSNPSTLTNTEKKLPTKCKTQHTHMDKQSKLTENKFIDTMSHEENVSQFGYVLVIVNNLLKNIIFRNH